MALITCPFHSTRRFASTIQELLKVAKNQSSIQETVNKLQREVDKQQVQSIVGRKWGFYGVARIEKAVVHNLFFIPFSQEDIKKLQTNLKEAESLLSNAVYQAKQKLEHIRKANR